MSALWAKMSMRERGLAVAVAVLLVAGLGYIIVTSAMDHLERQEAEIDRLEQQLINFSRQMERRSRVDAAFDLIATQHSSEWTGEEIYDRLGSEIYRLARQDPGEPGSAGSGPDIVPIPQLPPGELERNPEGYRSYTVEFQTGDTSVDNLTAFLRRLEESTQALRIEALDIRRPPDRLGVAQASIRVNRTVVDGVEEAAEPLPMLDSPRNMLPTMAMPAGNLAPHGSFEVIEAGNAEGWTADNCQVTPTTDFVSDGSASAKLEWQEAGAAFAQPVELMGGRSYTMTIDLMATAPVSIAVVDQDTGNAYEGVITVAPDGAFRSYTMAFTVPGSGPRQVLAPRLSLEGSGGNAIVDRVRIRPFSGAK